jgi:hypothetical protein
MDIFKKVQFDRDIRLLKLSKEAIDHLLKGNFKESFACIVETAPITGRNELTRLFCVNKNLIIKSLVNKTLNCTAAEIDFIRSILYFAIGNNEKALFLIQGFNEKDNNQDDYKRVKLVECLILEELGRGEESKALAKRIHMMTNPTISGISAKAKPGA